jgi:hypothetical protein
MDSMNQKDNQKATAKGKRENGVGHNHHSFPPTQCQVALTDRSTAVVFHATTGIQYLDAGGAMRVVP